MSFLKKYVVPGLYVAGGIIAVASIVGVGRAVYNRIKD
jgi:hypothetical protein